MTDRIVLREHAVSRARHGVGDEELRRPQPFEVDVELVLDLRAGRARPTTSTQTVDYGGGRRDRPPDRRGERSFRLLEAIAEAIAAEHPRRLPGRRGRRPGPQAGGPLAGPIDYAGVEIRRARASGLTRRLGPDRTARRAPDLSETGRPDAERDLERLRLAVRGGRSASGVARRELREDRVERVLACRSSRR